ncbi:MAG: hypothetical protein N3A59_01620 [Thermodesulfovibrionales bacterium]|nr:hypothetical protein [Thermodesulfovibrionales bacterium]
MSQIPEAVLTHCVKNRIRLKVPSKKGNTDYFKFVEKKFLECCGLAHIKVKPEVGSILIQHTIDIVKISEFAKKHEIFNLKSLQPQPLNLHSRISKTFTDLNTHFQKMTGGNFDIADIVFLSLLGIGFYQISRGNITAPAWYTAFWYALGIFFKSSKK